MIIISFQQVNLPLPSNINLVVNNLDDLQSFNVFDANSVLEQCLNFTETEEPEVGFRSIGINQKRLIMYLGPMCFIVALSVSLYLVYGLVLLLQRRFAIFTKVEEKMRNWFGLKYNHILTLII